MERLTQRRDFLAAARGRRLRRSAFVLQWRCRKDAGPTRIGFTVTKRIAPKSVERNRIRRRLRAAVRCVSCVAPQKGADIVLVARRAALTEPFAKMANEVGQALSKIATGTRDGAENAQRGR